MQRSKLKTTTPPESAAEQDEIQPCERPFMLDCADTDHALRYSAEGMIQDDSIGEAFCTIPQSNDAAENHDDDNINYSTNDSDSDDDNRHKNRKPKKKRKVSGGMENKELPNKAKTTGKDVNNTEENYSRHQEEPKWNRRVSNFYRNLKPKKREKVQEGRSKGTPHFWPRAMVDESKTDKKGMDSDVKTPVEKGPSPTGGKMNGLAERKTYAQCPSISQSHTDVGSAVDEDNIESEEEGRQDEEGGSRYGRPRSRRENNEMMEPNACVVFPHFDPTASGNNRVYRVSKFRENIDSYDHNAIRGERVEMLRQERQAIRLYQQRQSTSDSVSVSEPKMPDENLRTADDHEKLNDIHASHDSSAPSVNEPTNQSNPNFHTRTVYSVERTGEIISTQPLSANINFISAMYVAPPEQSRKSTLGSKLRKLVPKRLRKICFGAGDEPVLTQEMTERGPTRIKTIRKESNESLGALIEYIKEILKKKVDDSERNTHSTEQVLQQNGTRDLERQVSESTPSAPNSCTLSRSNAIRSAGSIIEDDSRKAEPIEGGSRTENQSEITGGSPGTLLEDNAKDVMQCCPVLKPAPESSSSPGPSMQAVASSQNTPSESTSSFHVCYMGEHNRKQREKQKKFRKQPSLRTTFLKRSLRPEDIWELRAQRTRRAREALERASNNAPAEDVDAIEPIQSDRDAEASRAGL